MLGHGPAHTSKASREQLAARAAWVHVMWLAKDSPHLSPKEREWRRLKRGVRGHLARGRREFVDEIADGLRRPGGDLVDVRDQVPAWFLAGHRKAPTGRPPGRPKGAKDRQPRQPRRKSVPRAMSPRQ